jgi:serine/threonine protein kinase
MPRQTRPILVVDDDTLGLRVLESLFKQAGHTVVSTVDPDQALTLVEQHRPCMAIIDLNMPDMDGLSLLTKIRERLPIPVIILTGMDKSEYAVRALKMGAYDYVTKPYDFRRLLDTVAMAVGTEADVEEARRISHYIIRRELGRGGMGVVYEARDRNLDRLVALKVLLPEMAADPAFELRFLREARAAAKLSHPGLVTVFEAGRYRGKLYIAMELVDGKTLARYQEQGHVFALTESLKIVADAAEAMQVAHAAGLVHRDIKPANLMLTKDGRVKVLDFGLVAPAKTGQNLATPVVGTPAYVAPEIIEGKSADQKSDIYSLGVVLYELLANEQAFWGDTLYDLLNNITQGRVRRPLRTVEGLPPEYCALCERMMALRRDDRPASLVEVVGSIRRMLSLA